MDNINHSGENLLKLKQLVEKLTADEDVDIIQLKKVAADAAEEVIKKAADTAEEVVRKAAEIAATVIKDAAVIADELHKIVKK